MAEIPLKRKANMRIIPACSGLSPAQSTAAFGKDDAKPPLCGTNSHREQ